MTLCPRCGTGLLPGAAVCTTCCHRLDGSVTDAAPVVIDVAQPLDAEVAPPMPTPEDEARRRLIQAQHAALATPDALGIPNQRSAVFNPIQVAATPPPNRYLEASRRQQSNFGSVRFDLEESGVRADCSR